ncbi:hypothetical protein GCM10009727_39340 [Actinomadura napierensis]|uniref:Uncharacterized protein n=1 Tax=Actinomadura napierensis TaxID=267854 RepID=A0ABN2ZFZ9_9ACTN
MTETGKGQPRQAVPDEPRRLATGAAGRGGRRGQEMAPRFVWTVAAAEGDVAEALERAQTEAIMEVLEWARTNRARFRSGSSDQAPGRPDGDG